MKFKFDDPNETFDTIEEALGVGVVADLKSGFKEVNITMDGDNNFIITSIKKNGEEEIWELKAECQSCGEDFLLGDSREYKNRIQ